MTPQRWIGLPMVAMGLMVTLSAQAPKPTFDVASVKVHGEKLTPANVSTAFFRVRRPGVVTGTHVTVDSLVRFAYGLQGFQVVGAPEWIRRDMFDVDARTAVDAPAAQIRFMVQSLLEDRFKLVTHMERRDMRYAALVLARKDGKLGPYLRRLDDGACDGKSVGEVYREK